MTVVTDLKANPEPLKLFNSLRILISNLTSSDNAFATEVSQMYRSTQIKTSCTDRALMEFMNLLEIEMSHRAMEDDEDRRRRGQANMAASSSHSPSDAANAAANAVGKGGKKGKGSLRVEEKERRGQYVRSISQIKDVLKETNVLMLTPERQANV